MFESLSQRTVIIGNSGAGKSALAESLAASIHVPVIDLDLLNWEGNGYGRKRDEDAARRMTLEVSTQPLWIIEGVYGWLADVALPRATALIWLDFPWSLCRAGLLARSPRRGATDQDTVELLKWAETYWNRQTPSSFAGHSRMFANFPSTKFRLETREQATILLADLRACMIALKGDEQGVLSMVGETGCPMSALNTAALLETFRFGDFVVVAPIAWYTDAIPMRFEVSVLDENLASEPQWWFNLIRQISIRKS